jgi:hypothetical protein
MIKKTTGAASRADLLAEVESLTADAFLTPQQAAAVLATTPSVLANWRSQRRGPGYCGNKGFIRYRRDVLQRWMSARTLEVAADDGDRHG